MAKVIASGKTPAGSHIPIMVDECLAALGLAPGQTGVDGTLGYGGHARRILETILPGGKLIGLDQYPLELPKTVQCLRGAGYGEDCFEPVRSNYAGIAKALAGRTVDFVFADLGCSSMPCGRQASDTFRPLFSISPRMRMICSALCLFFICLFCWFYPAKLSSKSVLITGAGSSPRPIQ